MFWVLKHIKTTTSQAMNSFCRDRKVGQVLADSNLLTWFDLYIYIYCTWCSDKHLRVCTEHTHTCHPTLLFLMIEQSWNILFPNSRRLILVEELLCFFFWCMLLASWMSLGVTLAPMWTSPNVIRNFWTRQRGVQSTNPNGLSFAAH